MKRLTGTLIAVLAMAAALAQKTSIKGRILDSVIQKGLAYTTVSLVNEKDSTLVSFSRADSSGYFSLNAVDKGNYLLAASYVGYNPVWKPVRIAGTSATEDIGNLYLQDIASAGSLTVTAKRPPVVINNDTLEFNSENFQVQPNAVVEDMLKKMPGVTVESDGTIRVNGQAVRRVLVNGKDFFSGDVKMATKNLNADAVDKVQVFDRLSDQAQFTGVDDGNREKTINLKLKKDRNKALFGKVTAGAGDDERYDAQANINRFNGDEQLSFLGMSNNTNRQGFSMQDILNFTGELSRGMRNGGGITIRTDGGDDNGLPVTGLGQNQQGIATTTAAGVNYNNTWNKGKTDLSANYTYSDVSLFTDKQTTTQNLTPGGAFNSNQHDSTVNDGMQHRLNVVLDQKVDSSFSVRIAPSLTWQQSQKTTLSNYISANSTSKINEGFSNTISDADAFNFNGTALLRKKFKTKGRTMSLNLNTTYNHSTSDGAQVSENSFLSPDGSWLDSNINQTNNRDAISRNFGARLVYTEPMGKKSLLEFSSYISSSTGYSNKQTYDYDDASGKHDVINTALSNDFNSNYRYTGGGINYRTNQKKMNISAGASLQAAELKTVNNTLNQTVTQRFTDVLPTATLQYNISRTKNIRLEYSTSTTQPTMAQLQPVPDVSNPLNIITGNPSLRRQYNNNIMLNVFGANPAKRKHLFAFINFNAPNNAIVRSDSISSGGSRRTTYTNTNGVYNLNGNIEIGIPLKKIKSRIELGTSTGITKGATFVNGERNAINTVSIGPYINYNLSIDNKIDFSITGRVSYNTSTYSLQPEANNKYFRHNYGAELTNYLPWGIVLSNQFNYIINTGRSEGYNANIPLWNASIAKGVLKNRRGEIKFSMADILNKNTGISRTVNQGYITDEKYNVLQRYFLFSFTYSLNKAGLNGGGPRAVIKTFNN